MNNNSFVTLTFGDQAENHAGMEKLGKLVNKGEGFNYDDLIEIKTNLECINIYSTIIPLDLYENINEMENDDIIADPAFILIIHDGVNKLLQHNSEYTQLDMFNEHCMLDVDKKAWMKGRVVNKHARWNLCFDNYNREPDYEHKMGRIISYNDIPITKQLLSEINKYFGDKSHNLKGEGNYYYDISKCGIGFHGDSERRKVIGIRLGINNIPQLHFQWFRHSKPVGQRIIIELFPGDIYIMSEKAVGQDWKKSSIYTLRHATGTKFT